MLNVNHIILTQQELMRCVEFSKRSAPNQQAIEFGQHTTKARSENEIARDNLIGKIAEVAFSKMMKENYGIDVPLDFNYYPRGQWDNQDAEINGWRIDVKGTRCTVFLEGRRDGVRLIGFEEQQVRRSCNRIKCLTLSVIILNFRKYYVNLSLRKK